MVQSSDVRRRDSTPESNDPSSAKKGVPFPSPGSKTPKKYSACVMVGASQFWSSSSWTKTVLEKRGPH